MGIHGWSHTNIRTSTANIILGSITVYHVYFVYCSVRSILLAVVTGYRVLYPGIQVFSVLIVASSDTGTWYKAGRPYFSNT